jgi:hypothetical protein
MIWLRRTLAIAVLALFCAVQPVAAQGLLTSFSCEDIREPLSVRIDLLDDAPPMLKLRESIVAALGKRGITIASDAPYVLSFEAEAIRRALRRKGRDLGSITDSTDEEMKARINVWSNREDSIIGGRKDSVVSEAIDEMRVIVSIHRVSDGKCVWRGEAVHDTEGREQWSVADSMAPVLVEAIGRESTKRPFDLP